MNSNPEHIKELCSELHELGINITPKNMELILKMQDMDFQNLTRGIDPAREFENLLSKFKGD